jgi:ribonuclease HI
MYTLQFDGMLHLIDEKMNKAGLLGYGWFILNNDVELARGFGLTGHRSMASSTVAEYLALIEGLDGLLDMRIMDKPIEIRGDARCVIDQMKGTASIRSLPIQKLYRRAQRLASHFDSLSWTWVPRKKNKFADHLSRRGLNQLFTEPDAYENMLSRLNTRPAKGNGLISLLDLRVYTPLSTNLLQVD